MVLRSSQSLTSDQRYRTLRPTLMNRGPVPMYRSCASAAAEERRYSATSLGVARAAISGGWFMTVLARSRSAPQPRRTADAQSSRLEAAPPSAGCTAWICQSSACFARPGPSRATGHLSVDRVILVVLVATAFVEVVHAVRRRRTPQQSGESLRQGDRLNQSSACCSGCEHHEWTRPLPRTLGRSRNFRSARQSDLGQRRRDLTVTVLRGVLVPHRGL